MQTPRASFTFPLLLTLCFCTAVSAQQIKIGSMKLLAPGVGWAASSDKLYWTTDNGANWKDITPKLKHKSQSVSSVFFSDSSTGWVLLHCEDERSAKADDVCFEFASSTDAGQSWSITHPKIVDPVLVADDDPGVGFSNTYLDFVDSQHGWIVLKNGTRAGISMGVMLRTADGGQAWKQLSSDLPSAEPFVFANARDGWMPNADYNGLYVSHDGGDSWQDVPPAEQGELPVFENTHRGFLLSGNILLITNDGGKSWKKDRTVKGFPQDYSASTVANSFLITARGKNLRVPVSTDSFYNTREISLYMLGTDGIPGATA